MRYSLFLIFLLFLQTQQARSLRFYGEFQVLALAQPSHGIHQHYLKTTHDRHALSFMNKIPDDILSGNFGFVDGELDETNTNVINVMSYTVNKYAPTDVTETNEVTALAIPLKICGWEPPSQSQLTDLWRQQNASAIALNNYMSNCTYGKYSLASISQVTPTIELPCVSPHYNYNSNVCGGSEIYGWMQHAMDIANTYFSIDTSKFRHIMLMLPHSVTCGWAGLGQLGCGSQCFTWYVGNYGKMLNVLMHELGHNFGLHHSSTQGAEYGDTSCTMGSIFSNICYNVPQSWVLGVTSPKIILNNTNFANRNANTTNIYDIESHLVNSTNFIKIDVDWIDTTTSYFISFRTPISYDKFLMAAYKNKVFVHKFIRQRANGKLPVLIAVLDLLNSYEIPSTNLVVKFLSMPSASTAKVQVSSNLSPPSPPSSPRPPPPPLSSPRPPFPPPIILHSLIIRVPKSISNIYITETLCVKLQETLRVFNSLLSDCIIEDTSSTKSYRFMFTMSAQNIFLLKSTLGSKQRLNAFTDSASLVCGSVISFTANGKTMFVYKSSSTTCKNI
jgi:hypothetical protein